jgi:hypothetical protein
MAYAEMPIAPLKKGVEGLKYMNLRPVTRLQEILLPFSVSQATNGHSESALQQGFINQKSKIYGSKIGSILEI